jgi:cysteine-rich secretory family protein
VCAPVLGVRARRGLLTAALVGILLAVALPPSPIASASSSNESRLVSLVNAERANRGLSKLSTASDLMSIAHRHSAQMASRRSIFHNSSLTSEVRGWRAIGENVGRGPTVSSVHNAFMSSSSHRAHILSGRYKQIGTGVVKGSDGYLYVTEVFVDRGTVARVSRSTTRRVTRSHHAPVRRRARPKAVRKVFVIARPPDRAVGMLLKLLAIDSEIAARKDMSGGSAAR